MRLLMFYIISIVQTATLQAQGRPDPTTASATDLIHYSYNSFSVRDKVSFRSAVVKRFKNTPEFYFAQAYMYGHANDPDNERKALEEGLKQFPKFWPIVGNYIVNGGIPKSKKIAQANRMIQEQPDYNHYGGIRSLYDLVGKNSFDSLQKVWKPKLRDAFVFDFLRAVGEEDKMKALELYYSALDKKGGKEFFTVWKRICDLELNVLFDRLDDPYRGLRELKAFCTEYENSNSPNKKFFLGEAYHYLAEYYTKKNLTTLAIAYYRSSYDQMPTFESVDGLMDALYENHEMAPECLPLINQAMLDLKDIWGIYFSGAWAYLRENKFNTADSLFQLSIEKTNTITDQVNATRNYTSFLISKTFNYGKASRLLKDLIGFTNVDRATVYEDLSRTMYLAGSFHEAKQYLENARTVRRLANDVNEGYYTARLKMLNECLWFDSVRTTTGASLIRKPIGISASAALPLDWSAFSNSGKTIFAGYQPAQLWDLEKQTAISSFEGLLDGERYFSPDDEWVAQVCRLPHGESHYLVLIIEIKTGTIKSITPMDSEIYSLSWSPDQKQIILSTANYLIKADIESGKLVQTAYVTPGNRSSNIHAKWLSNGKIFYAKKGFNSTAGILNPSTLSLEKNFGMFEMAHAMNETRNGKFICLSDNRRVLHYWDTEQFDHSTISIAEFPSKIVSHPSESKILINDWGGRNENHVGYYDLTSGEKLDAISLGTPTSVRLAFSHTGNKIYAAHSSWDNIEILNSADFKDRTKLTPPSSKLRSVQYFPEKSLLMTSDKEGLHIWNLRDGKKVNHINVVPTRILRPKNSNQLILAVQNSDVDVEGNFSTLETLDLVTGQRKTIATLAYRVTQLGLNNEKLIVATVPFTKADAGSQTGHIMVIDFKSGVTEASWSITLPTDVLLYNVLGGSGYNSMDVSPDGKLIALNTWWVDGWRMGATNSKTVRVFDLHTGEEKARSSNFTYKVDQVLFLSSKEIRVNNWVYAYPSWEYLRQDNTAIDSPISEHSVTVNDQKFIDASRGIIIRPNVTNEIKFYNSDDDAHIGTLICRKNNEWIFFTDNNYYESVPAQPDKIYLFQTGELLLPYDQMFNTYFRPSLMRDVLNKKFSTARDQNKERQIVDNARKVPIVRIVSPVTGYQAKGPAVKILVEVTDNGAGVSEIQLYQNGKLVSVQSVHGQAAQNVYSEMFDATLTGGTNLFKASALSKDKVEAIPDLITINLNQESQTPRLFILTIGINNYKNTNYNLNYGEADAKAIALAFKHDPQKMFREVKTFELYDAIATKGNIVNALSEIKTQAKPNDVFLFFYAGHGVVVEGESPEQNDFYLVLQDVTQMYGTSVSQKGLSAHELKNLLAELPPQKQVILLDACQSGAVVDAFTSRGAEREKAIIQLGRSTGVFVLASAGSTQFATEFAKLGHGVFTHSVLESLSGQSQSILFDGKLTIKELEAYLTDRVPELTQLHRGTQQWPTSFSRGQDFPIRIFEKK